MQYALNVSEVLAVFLFLMAPAIVRTMFEARTALPTILCNAFAMIALYNVQGTSLSGIDLSSFWGYATLTVSFACTSVLCISSMSIYDEEGETYEYN